MDEDIIITAFSQSFDLSPAYYIKAPGRVNLIGEHTDYNGFPVLPIAIPFTINVAASPRNDKKICIKNISSRYEPVSFELEKDIPHSPQGHWANYVKAAVTALVSHCNITFSGMNALYDGNIPKSAGLSSSSALVIASALALLAVNKYEMDSLKLAELMAEGEHYVGTQGGGMDQAICILGKKGKAVRIDFSPLQYDYIPFLEKYSVIVAHSLIQASKTKNALIQYNRRAAECRLATALINAVHKPLQPVECLGDLPHHDFFRKFNKIEDFIYNTFDRELYSLSEIAEITGETEDSLTGNYLLSRDGTPIPFPVNEFYLRRRALHILTEADRVERSCDTLRQNDAIGFGKLMNASHQSCDRNYEISTPELNTLVSIMSESGAPGARLTGAGFGGCAIALVRDDDIQKIMENIHEMYYNTYIGEKHPNLLENLDAEDKKIFAVKPDQGAEITAL